MSYKRIIKLYRAGSLVESFDDICTDAKFTLLLNGGLGNASLSLVKHFLDDSGIQMNDRMDFYYDETTPWHSGYIQDDGYGHDIKKNILDINLYGWSSRLKQYFPNTSTDPNNENNYIEFGSIGKDHPEIDTVRKLVLWLLDNKITPQNEFSYIDDDIHACDFILDKFRIYPGDNIFDIMTNLATIGSGDGMEIYCWGIKPVFQDSNSPCHLRFYFYNKNTIGQNIVKIYEMCEDIVECKKTLSKKVVNKVVLCGGFTPQGPELKRTYDNKESQSSHGTKEKFYYNNGIITRKVADALAAGIFALFNTTETKNIPRYTNIRALLKTDLETDPIYPAPWLGKFNFLDPIMQFNCTDFLYEIEVEFNNVLYGNFDLGGLSPDPAKELIDALANNEQGSFEKSRIDKYPESDDIINASLDTRPLNAPSSDRAILLISDDELLRSPLIYTDPETDPPTKELTSFDPVNFGKNAANKLAPAIVMKSGANNTAHNTPIKWTDNSTTPPTNSDKTISSDGFKKDPSDSSQIIPKGQSQQGTLLNWSCTLNPPDIEENFYIQMEFNNDGKALSASDIHIYWTRIPDSGGTTSGDMHNCTLVHADTAEQREIWKSAVFNFDSSGLLKFRIQCRNYVYPYYHNSDAIDQIGIRVGALGSPSDIGNIVMRSFALIAAE